MFHKPSAVYFSDDFPGEKADADLDGFEIILKHPDRTGCVPVRRVSDGEYFCLPLVYLSKVRSILPKLTIQVTISGDTAPYSAAVISDGNSHKQYRGNARMFTPMPSNFVSW